MPERDTMGVSFRPADCGSQNKETRSELASSERRRAGRLLVRPAVFDHAVLPTPGKLHPQTVIGYLGLLDEALADHRGSIQGIPPRVTLDSWLAFARGGGTTTSPGEEDQRPLGSSGERLPVTPGLFTVEEIRAYWSVFIVFVNSLLKSSDALLGQRLYDGRPASIDIRELGVLLLMQTAKSGGHLLELSGRLEKDLPGDSGRGFNGNRSLSQSQLLAMTAAEREGRGLSPASVLGKSPNRYLTGSPVISGPIASPRSSTKSLLTSPRKCLGGGWTPAAMPNQLTTASMVGDHDHPILHFVRANLQHLVYICLRTYNQQAIDEMRDLYYEQFAPLHVLLAASPWRPAGDDEATRLVALLREAAGGEEGCSPEHMLAVLNKEVDYMPRAQIRVEAQMLLWNSTSSAGCISLDDTPLFVLEGLKKQTILWEEVHSTKAVAAALNNSVHAFQSPLCCTPQVSRGDVLIEGLVDCTVYIPQCVGFLKIHDCRNCKIVVIASSAIVTVVNCTSLQLHAAAHVIKVENNYDSQLMVFTPAPVLLLGDSRSTTLGPFDVLHPRARELMCTAGLPYAAQFATVWASPIVLSSALGVGDDPYHHLRPEDFWIVAIPDHTTAQTSSELVLPEAYAGAVQDRRKQVVRSLSVVSSLRVPATQIQKNFLEWVTARGLREVHDLVLLDAGNTGILGEKSAV